MQNARHVQKWEFMPKWAGSKLAKTSWVKARSETAAEKPVFRQAFAKRRLESCAILTGDANAMLCSIHDRMPVVIPKEYYHDWLNPTQDKKTPLKLY